MNHSKDEFRDLIQLIKSADAGRAEQNTLILEAASANISLSGDSASEVQQLMQLFKNAGMENAGEVASTISSMPSQMDNSPCDGDDMEPMKKSLPALVDNIESEFDEDGYDNAPEEDYKDSEFMNNTLAGGINKPKKSFAPAARGDNPMAVEGDQYNSIKTDLYSALRSLMSEGDDEKLTGNNLLAYNDGVRHGKKKGSKIGDINVSDEYGPTGSDFNAGFSAGKKQATNEASSDPSSEPSNPAKFKQAIQNAASEFGLDGKLSSQQYKEAYVLLLKGGSSVNDAVMRVLEALADNNRGKIDPSNVDYRLMAVIEDELQDLYYDIKNGSQESIKNEVSSEPSSEPSNPAKFKQAIQNAASEFGLNGKLSSQQYKEAYVLLLKGGNSVNDAVMRVLEALADNNRGKIDPNNVDYKLMAVIEDELQDLYYDIKNGSQESIKNEGKKGKKPDFLDVDKDGNKKETFKKALKDKKSTTECKTNEKYKPHMMYDEKTGKSKMAKVEQDHKDLAKKGWSHKKPTVKASLKKKVAVEGKKVSDETDTSSAERQVKQLAKAYAPDRYTRKSSKAADKSTTKKKTNESKIDYSAILPATEVITESAEQLLAHISDIITLATKDVSASSKSKQSSAALDIKRLAGL
jgi:hypothetical protein